MQNSPSSHRDLEPQLPSAKEIKLLYPRLAESEKLLQAAGRILLAEKMANNELNKAAIIQIYLNYCEYIQNNFPTYTEQAKMAFTYISKHADQIDTNDNTSHLRQLYPFLGPLITTIRNS